MDEKQYQKTHRLSVTNRGKLQMTGVKDVISFDMDEVLLETEQGILLIRGRDLKVNRLTLEKEEVDMDGTVDTLVYSETSSYKQKGKSLFKRLIK